MGYKRTWKPSKTAARAFAESMREIDEFCTKHGIHQSRSGDSYYFMINGKNYRVSNHSVEASDAAAYDDLTGEQQRELYHGGRDAETIYIHAGKTRILQIYNDLAAGVELDGRGNRK